MAVIFAAVGLVLGGLLTDVLGAGYTWVKLGAHGAVLALVIAVLWSWSRFFGKEFRSVLSEFLSACTPERVATLAPHRSALWSVGLVGLSLVLVLNPDVRPVGVNWCVPALVLALLHGRVLLLSRSARTKSQT